MSLFTETVVCRHRLGRIRIFVVILTATVALYCVGIGSAILKPFSNISGSTNENKQSEYIEPAILSTPKSIMVDVSPNLTAHMKNIGFQFLKSGSNIRVSMHGNEKAEPTESTLLSSAKSIVGERSLSWTVIRTNPSISLSVPYNHTIDKISIVPPTTGTTVPYVPEQIKILQINREICINSPSQQWIIVIHSNPRKPKLRTLIRETWARLDLFKDNRTKVIFLVGSHTPKQGQNAIDKEVEIYRDIVQGDFYDTYRNLTLKAIMGLYFVAKYCPHVPYVIKADDDAFINIFKLMELVKTKHLKERFLMCFKAIDPVIMRRSKGKCGRWCVSDDVFPGETMYPSFCPGMAYIISTDLILELYNISKSTPYFPLDDVFVTGILMKEISHFTWIDLTDIYDKITIQGRTIKDKPNEVLISHIHIESTWRIAWEKLVSDQNLNATNFSSISIEG